MDVSGSDSLKARSGLHRKSGLLELSGFFYGCWPSSWSQLDVCVHVLFRFNLVGGSSVEPFTA